MAGQQGEPGIELPAPTSYPLYFALGLALLLAGLVTHELVSLVGAVAALGGAVGWWREVLPRQREIEVALQPESERARAIVARPRAVEHLVAGEAQHRLRLPVEVRPLSSGLRGGAAGAVAMAVVACAYGVIAHGSPWLPINLLAGVALPGVEQASLEELRGFDMGALLLATLTHASISLLMGLVYAALLPMLPGRPLVWGGIVAPLAWTGLAWASIGILDPPLAKHVSWPWFIVSQIAFGLAAGAVITRVEPIETLQSASLAERAGLEARGVSEEKPEAD